MDARVINTKKVLREALLQCLKEKNIKDVSITEICDIAKVNRTTFYKHYKSCQDIIKEIEQEQLDDFRRLLASKDLFGEDLISDILSQIEKSKEDECARVVHAFSENYIYEMAAIAKEYSFDAWKKKMPKATTEEVELALTTMISATLHVVVKEMDKYDRETIVRYINNMITGCISMYASCTSWSLIPSAKN